MYKPPRTSSEDNEIASEINEKRHDVFDRCLLIVVRFQAKAWENVLGIQKQLAVH